MKSIISNMAAFIFSLAMLSLLVSCGGSATNQSANTSNRTGTVGILLTDKPADPSLFLSINAAIESAELMGSDDDEERITLYSGPTKTFDLLRLRNEAIPFTYKDDVPTGTYCKIRLTLSDLELVLADETPEDATDNETYHPKLPGNGKLDLVAKDCFEVGAGAVTTLQIDIDAGNSIHIVGNNNGYNFRPVVFIDVLSQDFESKLVRLEGTLTKTDDDEQILLLCNAIPTTHIQSEGCVEVALGDDTAFFDNQEYEGMPRALDELFQKAKLEQSLTVIGWPQYRVPPYMDIEVPEGHYPPRGECILWKSGVEPGQQDEPIDCDDLPDEIGDDVVVVTHEGIEKAPHYPLMVLDALAIELGEFLQLEGEVAADADEDGFTMDLADSASIKAENPLSVLLQKGEYDDINGTRIVSKTGELLEASDILAMLPVQVDGVLNIDTDTLKAALVILDVIALGNEQVTGIIESIEDGYITLIPEADTVCGFETELLQVNLSNELDLLTVVITDEESVIEPGGFLEAGQTIGMNGVCETSGYETDNVVIVDDQRD